VIALDRTAPDSNIRERSHK